MVFTFCWNYAFEGWSYNITSGNWETTDKLLLKEIWVEEFGVCEVALWFYWLSGKIY